MNELHHEDPNGLQPLRERVFFFIVTMVALSGVVGFFLNDKFTSNQGRFADPNHLREMKSSILEDKAQIEKKFSRSWPRLQTALCPNMVPTTSLGYTLFDLARSEAGLKRWNGTNDEEGEKLFSQFFKRYHGAFFYVSPDKQPTVYMDIWKCAHQQMRGWANETLSKLDGEFSVIKTVKNVTFSLKSLKKQKLLDQACIVTAIRDPVSHFLSGYNEIEFRNKREPDRLDYAPGLLFPRYQDGTHQRFEQFVADFLTGPNHGDWTQVFHREELDHLSSMSALLYGLAQSGAKMTSYLPSLNNLQEVWPQYIQKTCPGLPKSIVGPMHLVPQHESKKDEHGFYEASKRVWAEAGPTARALCALHAIDYACWEELPDGVPLVCQDVYSSPSFIEGIRA